MCSRRGRGILLNLGSINACPAAMIASERAGVAMRFSGYHRCHPADPSRGMGEAGPIFASHDFVKFLHAVEDACGCSIITAGCLSDAIDAAMLEDPFNYARAIRMAGAVGHGGKNPTGRRFGRHRARYARFEGYMERYLVDIGGCGISLTNDAEAVMSTLDMETGDTFALGQDGTWSYWTWDIDRGQVAFIDWWGGAIPIPESICRDLEWDYNGPTTDKPPDKKNKKR